jgi:uncharacterized protein (DUF58 family)
LIALLGLSLGMVRGQSYVALICLSMLMWIVWEQAKFLWRSARELESIQIERMVNDRTSSSSVLFAGRSIDVVVNVRCGGRSMYPQRVIREVLPENLQLIRQVVDATELGLAPTRKQGLLNGLLRVLFDLFQIHDEVVPANEIHVRSLAKNGTKQIQLRYGVKALAAGDAILPGLRIEFRDVWGLFRKDRFVACPHTFQVLPSYVALKEMNPLVKRLNTIPRQGIHRQQRSGLGFELLELREYRDGDPPKSIAWKASARRESLMTRQYESECPVRVQLIIDGTASTRVGGFGLRLIDQITSAAATVAHSVVAAGDAIGSYLVDEQGVYRNACTTGQPGFYRQLQALSKFAINTEPHPPKLSTSLLETAYALCCERYPELLDPQTNAISLAPFSVFISRAARQRNQIAAVLSELYDMSVTEQTQMVLDEPLFVRRVTRFMHDAGMPWMAPLVSASDVAWYQPGARTRGLTQAITTAISYARDNEVFVVIAELMGSPRHRDSLLEAFKTAKAHHHRLVVICPSPTFTRPTTSTPSAIGIDVRGLRMAAEHIQIEELAMPLKRSLAKLSIPMSISGEAKAMGLVLSEIELAKSGRIGSGGSRARGLPRG